MQSTKLTSEHYICNVVMCRQCRARFIQSLALEPKSQKLKFSWCGKCVLLNKALRIEWSPPRELTPPKSFINPEKILTLTNNHGGERSPPTAGSPRGEETSRLPEELDDSQTMVQRDERDPHSTVQKLLGQVSRIDRQDRSS